MLVQTSLRAIKYSNTVLEGANRDYDGITEKESCHLPIAFGAVIDWANIMALDFISCTSDTLPPFICNVKSHPQSFLMGLPIRL